MTMYDAAANSFPRTLGVRRRRAAAPSIAGRLTALREKCRLSEDEAAKRIGITLSLLEQIEGGQTPLTDAMLLQFVRVYGEFGESLAFAVPIFDEVPADQVLQELKGGGSVGDARRLWLLLGEPGIGKSTLLHQWFATWTSELTSPCLGLSVPVLVRLKELKEDAFRGEIDNIADRLWREYYLAIASYTLPESHPARAIYVPERGRAFRPIWLLDGLDEISLSQSDIFFERLLQLPGSKLLTSRTGAFEVIRDRAERYVEREFLLTPLKLNEQIAFLARKLSAQGRDASHSNLILEKIRENRALRELIARPLTLDLIAEAVEIPHNLVTFYRKAVDQIWHRIDRLEEEAAARLYHLRDSALTEMARRMALDTYECTLDEFTQATESAAGTAAASELQKALMATGLLRVDYRRRLCSFFHTTFQEFYLALALETDGLRSALEQHWSLQRYDDTLALAISLYLETGKAKAVDHLLHELLQWASKTHSADPRLLWRERRSSLRVVLHLVRLAGASFIELPMTAKWIGKWVRSSPLRRLAIALDRNAPPGALDIVILYVRSAQRSSFEAGTLDETVDLEVCRAIARNVVASKSVLNLLARFTADPEVRRSITENANAPAEALIYISESATDADLCRAIAQNVSAPAEALEHLMRHTDLDVRCLVAANPGAPSKILEFLAHDDDAKVRCVVARNPAAGRLVEYLSRDKDVNVRCTAARNASAPSELLEKLARSDEDEVRCAVARNPSAPVKLLYELIGRNCDYKRTTTSESLVFVDGLLYSEKCRETEIRCAVADNPCAPAALLKVLAEDEPSPWSNRVSSAIARHPSTPNECLIKLKEANSAVHIELAKRRTAPAEMLFELCQSRDAEVRRAVALNPSSPRQALSELARTEGIGLMLDALDKRGLYRLLVLGGVLPEPSLIQDHGACLAVASNPLTPADALAYLAYRFNDVRLGYAVARNPAVTTETHSFLARSVVWFIREAVAENRSAAIEILDQLSSDKDARVRFSVAQNQMASVEALSKLAYDEDGDVRVAVAHNPSAPTKRSSRG